MSAAFRCYPDEKGSYLQADKSCPWARKCHDKCIRPAHYESTTSEKHYTTEKYTTPKYETTTKKEYTTPKYETTTHKEYTTPKYETTTHKEYTTPKYETTTSEKHMTSTEKYEDNKKCPSGQWRDGKGCCPRKLAYQWFYRDGRGCYPIELSCGVYYADANGCYPDENGKYLKAGDHCPEHRKCYKVCDGGYY
jgi:hypothetical protein